MQANHKTVLYVSHDRELLSRTATRRHLGGRHLLGPRRRVRDVPRRPGGAARAARGGAANLRTLGLGAPQGARPHVAAAGRDLRGHGCALSRTVTRLKQFEDAGPRRRRLPRSGWMRLTGGRTGVRAMTCAGLELTGLVDRSTSRCTTGSALPCSARTGPGNRISSGSWPAIVVSHGEPGTSAPAWCPGISRRRTTIPSCEGRTLVDILWTEASRQRGPSDLRLAAVRAGPAGGPVVRGTLRWPAGAVPDPLARTGGGDVAPVGRADRQPRRRQRRGAQRGLARRTTAQYWLHPDRWFARSFDRFLVFQRCGRHRVKVAGAPSGRRAASAACADIPQTAPLGSCPAG